MSEINSKPYPCSGFSIEVLGRLGYLYDELGWDPDDNVVVEVGGSKVSGIHQPKEYNKKWNAPFGEIKYNDDAFIVIKNTSRDLYVPSQAPSQASEVKEAPSQASEVKEQPKKIKKPKKLK